MAIKYFRSQKYLMNVSTALLAIIGIAFLFQMASPSFTEAFIFAPLLAMQEPWRFITSMFLHGGITHLFFNGLALLLFGSVVERRIGPTQFIILYFVSGLIGGLAYYSTYLLGIIDPIPALGASGAIFGLLGAAAIMFPDMRIYVYFIPMKTKHAAVLFVFLEFFGAFNTASGIASAAHLGGLLFGLAYAWFLNRQGRQETYYIPPERWE